MFIDRLIEKKTQEAEQEVSSQRQCGEKPIRSLAKAISWRITGTIDTIILSYFFTGEIETAISIGLTEVVTKMFLYYGHERLWNRMSLGLSSPKGAAPTRPDQTTAYDSA